MVAEAGGGTSLSPISSHSLSSSFISPHSLNSTNISCFHDACWKWPSHARWQQHCDVETWGWVGDGGDMRCV